MADKIQHNTVEKLGDDYSKNYGMFSSFCLGIHMIMVTQKYCLAKRKKHFEKGKFKELVL